MPAARQSSPKHLRVAELLERDIRQLAPGTPILPVTALMKRFGVSQGTVVHSLRTLRRRVVCLRSGLRPSLRHTTRAVPQLSHEPWYEIREGVSSAMRKNMRLPACC
jgi:DNA-binding transcriptional MocR family regulator